MKRLLVGLVLLGIGAGAVGLGFYLGWFRIRSASADDKSNLTFSRDTDKFQKDSKTAVANVQDVGRHRLAEALSGAGDAASRGFKQQ